MSIKIDTRVDYLDYKESLLNEGGVVFYAHVPSRRGSTTYASLTAYYLPKYPAWEGHTLIRPNHYTRRMPSRKQVQADFITLIEEVREIDRTLGVPAWLDTQKMEGLL